MSHACLQIDGQMRRDFETFRRSLSVNHPLAVMIREHDVILGFLEKLDSLNKAFQLMHTYESGKPEFQLLSEIATNLTSAEPHHKREEDVVFPRLEEQGVHGPTYVMRSEHDDLRRAKHDLAGLAQSVAAIPFPRFKQQLDATARFLVTGLESHIRKENYILYPMAYRVLRDEGLWCMMEDECARIGNCTFTPTA